MWVPATDEAESWQPAPAVITVPTNLLTRITTSVSIFSLDVNYLKHSVFSLVKTSSFSVVFLRYDLDDPHSIDPKPNTPHDCGP